MKNERGSWRERWGTIKRGLRIPFVYLERFCKWPADRLNESAFINVLQRCGHLTILVAVILYVGECPERKKARHKQAWQVINSARRQAYSGGRAYALEELNRDGVSLAGIDLYQAILPDLNLRNARLMDALLAHADLHGSNLRGADLSRADLNVCNLCGANLSNARFTGARLEQTQLERANLSRADLRNARSDRTNFKGANLSGANLSGTGVGHSDVSAANLREASLTRADLAGTSFEGSDFAYADFSRADLRYADLANVRNWRSIRGIESANLFGVKNPPEGFLEWAEQHGAVTMSNEGKWRQLVGRE